MGLWSSIQFSLRILAKHWKLTSIAVFSLAIAMAAGAAGISIFNALLLRPPAVPAPKQLVTVYTTTPTEPFSGVCYEDYKYYRDNNHVFSDVLAFPNSITVRPVVYERRTKSGLINAVADNYFSVLGVQPLVGRVFTRGEDDKASALAVLSYSYWKWLGADPNIAGKAVTVNNVKLTIVGVTPKSFVGTLFSDVPDVWYPLSMDAALNHQPEDWRTDRTVQILSLVGRLKPGVTRQQAQADMQLLAKQLAANYPQTDKNRTAVITETTMLPADSMASGKIISALLLGIVSLVLFAACSNVANLLLALGNARRHEILVRAAMGATRARLIRELLVDSTVLAVVGGVLGFFLALLGLRQLAQFKPYVPGIGVVPVTIDFRPDRTVVLMTLAVIFVAGLATGLVPGLYACTPNLAGALSGEMAVGGTRKGRIRSTLVVIQVAVCTLVLIGTGLCFQSLRNLLQINPGFSARNLAILTADLQSNGYTEAEGRILHARVREAASQIYGVESVTLADDLPLNGAGRTEQVRVEGGRTEAGSQTGERISYMSIDGNFFSTLGIPLLAGRNFGATDTAKSPEVIIINHLMAQKYWPGQDPVGKTVRFEDGNRIVTVVGVVGDGKYGDLDEQPRPFMYLNVEQHYEPFFNVLLRTHGNPSQWLTPASEALQKLEPQLSFQTLTMNEWMQFAVYVPRITLICVSAFGGLAFALAALGLYGAVFYSVSERKKEMGIRVALGARPADLWRMILRQTSVVTVTGVCLGILAGIVCGTLVRSLLYGIHPVEWMVFLAVAVVMLAMAMVTAYSAARPWLQADPMESVRHA